MLKTLLLTFITLLSLQAREINLNTLNAQALKQNKHLFVFLHRTDCGYCDSMLQFTFDDDKVTPLLENAFLFVHINIFDEDSVTYKSFKGNGRAFAKHIGYNVYPTSLFFDAHNTLIYAAAGYRDEKDFYSILNYVNGRHYATMDYDDYKESLHD